MARTKQTIEVQTEHPLEEILNIESGTTVAEHTMQSTELVVIEGYDEKDRELEDQFQEIADAALSMYEDMAEDITSIEPKYRSRSQEVALMYLSTALSSIRDKAGMKKHKDKLQVQTKAAATPGTLNQTMIMDRNELLKALIGEEEKEDFDEYAEYAEVEEDIVDAEVEEVTEAADVEAESESPQKTTD